MAPKFPDAGAASGFREIKHTADWELEVWAPDMINLLIQAAQGMYALSGVRIKPDARVERVLELQAEDREGLLVDFLSEILFYGETENLAFDRFQLVLNGLDLHSVLNGAPIERLDKEIKAVTYHRLEVRQNERGLSVNIVFDV
jgi:SHS2 domain-containing protein